MSRSRTVVAVIAAIENAILARIKAASDAGALGYEFSTLTTYPEDWSEYLGAERGKIRPPAAWVTFAGWSRDPSRDGSRPPYLIAQFGVVVMSENVRNEQATRHGGPTGDSEPGSYQLVEDVAALFAGQSLGELLVSPIEIGQLRFVANGSAMMKRKVSMMALELRCGIRLPEAPTLDAELDDFESFHSNWDLPAFTLAGDPDTILPADALDDATDHLELPQ